MISLMFRKPTIASSSTRWARKNAAFSRRERSRYAAYSSGVSGMATQGRWSERLLPMAAVNSSALSSVGGLIATRCLIGRRLGRDLEALLAGARAGKRCHADRAGGRPARDRRGEL